jgi:microcystin-dependent protein
MEGYIAQILLFAGNFAPRNWAFCDGSIQGIAQNTALFSLLGTTYGGNGTTTFALPDLRGRVAVGAGNGPGLTPRTLGEVGGTETVTLTLGQLPAHTHPATATASVGVSNSNANSDDPDGSLLTTTGSTFYATGTPTGHLGGVSASATIGIAGSNQPVSVQSPYLALNYVICMFGIFPSRN